MEECLRVWAGITGHVIISIEVAGNGVVRRIPPGQDVNRFGLDALLQQLSEELLRQLLIGGRRGIEALGQQIQEIQQIPQEQFRIFLNNAQGLLQTSNRLLRLLTLSLQLMHRFRQYQIQVDEACFGVLGVLDLIQQLTEAHIEPMSRLLGERLAQLPLNSFPIEVHQVRNQLVQLIGVQLQRNQAIAAEQMETIQGQVRAVQGQLHLLGQLPQNQIGAEEQIHLAPNQLLEPLNQVLGLLELTERAFQLLGRLLGRRENRIQQDQSVIMAESLNELRFIREQGGGLAEWLDQKLQQVDQRHDDLYRQINIDHGFPPPAVVQGENNGLALERTIQSFESSLWEVTILFAGIIDFILRQANAHELPQANARQRILGIYCDDFRIWALPIHRLLNVPTYYILPARFAHERQGGYPNLICVCVATPHRPGCQEQLNALREAVPPTVPREFLDFNNNNFNPNDLDAQLRQAARFHYIGRVRRTEDGDYVLALRDEHIIGAPPKGNTLEFCFLSCGESLRDGANSVGARFATYPGQVVVGSYWLISENRNDQPLLVRNFYGALYGQFAGQPIVDRVCQAMHAARQNARRINFQVILPVPAGEHVSWRWDVMQCIVAIPCAQTQDSAGACHHVV